MFQRIAREQKPANAAVRQAPHPDHYVANAVGKTTLIPPVAPHFAPADRYTIGIEAAQRQVRAIRSVLLPALIKALRAKAKQTELVHAAMQLRYMLTSANEHLFALEKAATTRDPMLQFLRREIDTLSARAVRLGAYQGREHLIPHAYEEPSKQPQPMRRPPTDANYEKALSRSLHAMNITRPATATAAPAAKKSAIRPSATLAPAIGRVPAHAAPARYRGPVQRKAAEMAPSTPNSHAIAATGVANASSPLPYASIIQKAFGRHDISGVRVQIGGPAAEAAKALGARAYATGNTIAFASQPDLHTAAHEAAHVVQQRVGVHVGENFDSHGPHEAHADRIADLVVAGASAEAALDELVSGPR